MADIPEVFNHPGAAFVTLPAGIKFPPPYKGWQEPKNWRTYERARKHGGNVGIVAGNGYIGLDKDDPTAFDALELPTTTTWETRPGRLGMRFRCSDDIPALLAKYGKKGDQAQLKLFKDGRSVGEVKLQRTYQVIPPSWKTLEDGTRVDYRLLDTSPPAEISLEKLLADLQAIGITFNEKPKASRLQANCERIQGMISDARKNHVSDEVRTRRYAEAALESERKTLESTPPTNRNDQLNKSAFALGQFVGAGVLSVGEVTKALSRAAMNAGLEPDEIRRTIRSGLESGAGHPREIPEPDHANNSDPSIAKEPKSEERLSQADKIVKAVTDGDAILWHTPGREAYITVSQDGHKENYPLRSKAAKDFLAYQFHLLEDKAPGSQAIQDALNVLEGMALFEGSECPVYTRVGPCDGKIYVDLGDSTWEAIEISPDGWQIVKDPPVHFRRSKSMLALPRPIEGGEWDDLRTLVNAPDEITWIQTVAWLIQAYWPYGPYAHLVMVGEQGSGKSKISEILKNLVDPSVAALRRPPREERDLMVAAQSERVLGYDNLSGLKTELSDAFCCLSTGASFSSRQLYSNDEESLIGEKRPCILNGIDNIATRGDLLDRVMINILPALPEKSRLKEREIDAKFKEIHPTILGLILDATSTAMKRIDTLNLSNLPRMADFAEWVAAAEPALPWEEGTFMKSYKMARANTMKSLLETDVFALAVYSMAKSARAKVEYERIKGTATDLLTLLNSKENIHSGSEPRGWPKTPQSFSSRLRRISPQLRAAGCTWAAEITNRGTIYTFEV